MRRYLIVIVLLLAACGQAVSPTSLPGTFAPAARDLPTLPAPAWKEGVEVITLNNAPAIANIGRLDTASTPSTVFVYAVSPDGTRLAFYRGPSADRNIFIINIDGTGLEKLTNGGDNLGPSWSTDGNWITFTSFRDGNNEIYIMHPDGTGVTRLTNTPISDWQPRWGN